MRALPGQSEAEGRPRAAAWIEITNLALIGVGSRRESVGQATILADNGGSRNVGGSDLSREQQIKMVASPRNQRNRHSRAIPAGSVLLLSHSPAPRLHVTPRKRAISALEVCHGQSRSRQGRLGVAERPPEAGAVAPDCGGGMSRQQPSSARPGPSGSPDYAVSLDGLPPSLALPWRT